MRLILIAGALGIAAFAESCSPEAADPAVPAAEADTCGARGYAAMVGTSIAAITLPADLNARVIPPDSAITMDFQPSRINFDLDANGVVTRIWCG